MQADNIKYMSPNEQVQLEFNDWTQAYLKKTVWASSCSSWYKDSKGRNMAIWPGSAGHFMNFIKEPRFEVSFWHNVSEVNRQLKAPITGL